MTRALLALGLLLAVAAPTAALDLRDLDGARVRVSELEAEAIVLNFWATWCRPCREEMPELVSLQRDFADRGLRVVAASADEPGSERRIGRASRDWPGLLVLQGATSEDMEFFGLGTALPATAVFDADGHLVYRVGGVFDPKRLRSVVTRVLNGESEALQDELPPPVAVEPHRHDEPEQIASNVPRSDDPKRKRRSSLVPS